MLQLPMLQSASVAPGSHPQNHWQISHTVPGENTLLQKGLLYLSPQQSAPPRHAMAPLPSRTMARESLATFWPFSSRLLLPKSSEPSSICPLPFLSQTERLCGFLAIIPYHVDISIKTRLLLHLFFEGAFNEE